MPTVEERLAALEKQMAAWIDQRPTTHYTHQYSGEEIDNAVSRALPNGAIDQSVGTFVRPNLLDNWYFGRPVNQRGQTEYTGAFIYAIDRWQLGAGSISLSVAADGIVLKGGNNASTDYIYTRVERLPVGKYTFSVLFADNTANVVLTTRLTDISVVPAVESREASGVLALTWDQPEEFTADYAYFRIHIPGSAKILAAKLEIGPTQTLAHREGDKWVLNEIPDYGEQLRRCQRYCFAWAYGAKKMHCLTVMQCVRPGMLYGLIPTPVTMRTNPVCTGGSLTTFAGKVTGISGLTVCANGIRAIASIEGTNTVEGQAVGIENAEDNGIVIFSADL